MFMIMLQFTLELMELSLCHQLCPFPLSAFYQCYFLIPVLCVLTSFRVYLLHYFWRSQSGTEYWKTAKPDCWAAAPDAIQKLMAKQFSASRSHQIRSSWPFRANEHLWNVERDMVYHTQMATTGERAKHNPSLLMWQNNLCRRNERKPKVKGGKRREMEPQALMLTCPDPLVAAVAAIATMKAL